MAYDWNDNFSSKNKMSHDKHRKFFLLAKKLCEANVCDVDQVMELVKALYNHAYKHFKAEEEFALINRYDKSLLIRHKIEHSEFLSSFQRIDINSIRENPSKTASDFAKFTTEWIENHIKDEEINLLSNTKV